MFELQLLIVIFAVYLLAGCVKGVLGMGLPLVGVGLLTAIIGLQPAMALLIVPAFLTNVWQSLAGGHASALMRRFWTLFIPTMVFTWPGTLVLMRVNVAYLSALLGMLLIAYAILSLTRAQFRVPARWEAPLNPVIGAINGILAGLTGAFTVPGVAYLQSSRLKRDELVQAMGMLFTMSTIGLGVSLGARGLLNLDLGVLSLAAVVPTIIGLIVGTRVRKRISERSFRLIFLIALAILGAYIVLSSAFSLMA